MAISEEKMRIVIDNYFKSECDVNTSIHQAFEKGFRIGVKKGQSAQIKTGEWVEIENGEYLCSNCSHITIGYPPNCCPNCGSFNGGEEE